MTFKIKDGIRIGAVDVFNNSAESLNIKLKDTNAGAGYIGFATASLGSTNYTLTFPAATGTVALTSQIPTVNAGTLGVSIGTAGATNTTVTWGTTSGFNANTASNYTYDLKVGPALTNLASTMTGAGTGFLTKNGADTYSLDTNTYSTTSHTHYIGTTQVQATSANQAMTGVLSTAYAGATSGTITLIPTAAAGTNTITLPAATGTVALTSQLPTVNTGTLAVTVAEDGTTANSVYITTGTGFNANSSGATTYDIHVGPSLKNLADTMTGATTGFLKKTAADTYTLDTSTYLTAESDTLQSVTTRGASTNVATVTLSATTASTSTGSGALVVAGGVGIAGDLHVGGSLYIDGTTTTINSTTLTVDDKNIELGSVATPSDATADGGGITLKGTTDKTFNWISATAAWTSSEHLALAAGKTIIMNGSTSGAVTLSVPAAAGGTAIAFPATSGTVALTSQLPTVNNGTLTLNIGSAAATNNTVTVSTGTGYSANTASNVTYQLSVGPALTNLASTMTGAGTGFLKKNGADTYSLDTSTYLTTNSNDFSTFAIGADSGYTWGTANTNANQVADAVGDTLTIVRGLTGSTAGIDLYTSTVAGTDAIKIAHADTSTLSGQQGSTGVSSVTVDEMGHVTAVGTATYLTSYTETDTLQTVTTRGNTTTAGVQLNGSSLAMAGSTVAKVWQAAVVPANITANTATTIDSWASGTYRSAKYTIQLVQGTKYQQHEVRMIHDGTAVYMTEYAVLETNSAAPIPVTFAASITTGTLSVTATVTDAATTNVAVIIERTLFAV